MVSFLFDNIISNATKMVALRAATEPIAQIFYYTEKFAIYITLL